MFKTMVFVLNKVKEKYCLVISVMGTWASNLNVLLSVEIGVGGSSVG